MHKIDDNLLAAYLEGNLDEKEAEMVEQAIDEDEDLQAIVDDWVGIQGNLIAQKARQGLAASEYNVCAGNEGYCSNNPAPRKKPWRRIIAAASVVLMVGLGVFFYYSINERDARDYNAIPYSESESKGKRWHPNDTIQGLNCHTDSTTTTEDSLFLIENNK
jgi:anti-sigma-K factor RskA